MPHAAARIWALFQDYDRWPDYAPMVLRVEVLWPGDEQTATLVEGLDGTVAAIGDEAYENGTTADFANCYDPTWGRFKDRTRPAPGNHDYQEYGPPNPGVDTTADGYFGYFGVAAHQQPMGIYSYDLGAWHIVVLNSSFEEKVIISVLTGTSKCFCPTHTQSTRSPNCRQ